MTKVFAIKEVTGTKQMSHVGNTYVTTSAQYADEMADARHVLREIQSGKESCDNAAQEAGRKVKYYHITVMAVYAEEEAAA
jgi:hypothetical protein